MKTSRLRPIYFLLLLTPSFLADSCTHHDHQWAATQKIAITDSVKNMTANISRDLATKGPVAWLDYFDNSPQFIMISDGKVSFHGYNSANKFIRDTLSKKMSKISLKWIHMHIYLITRDTVYINSNVYEDITMSNGETTDYDGYFSGAALSTKDGWKLINLHWYTIKTMPR